MSEFLTIENIFWTLAVFSTVLYILKLLVFLVVGGDMEVDANFDSITEVETSFTFFSVQSILAFLMGFGWCGISAIMQFSVSTQIALVIALFCGFLCMYISALLMFGIKKLNKKVVVDINELVGKEGKAYTAIEPNSLGQIEISLNNKLTILAAVNVSEEKIEAFAPVKVEKVEDKKIYVVKI